MTKPFNVLDIGCGANPKGDVNIDLYPNRRNQSVLAWNPKKVENFVLADAEALPFRDLAFSTVCAFHVCEHLRNPYEAVKEWRRVAKRLVVRVPSPYNPDETSTHLFTWNESTLKNLLSLFFSNVNVRYVSKGVYLGGRIARYVPLLRLALNRFPKEIEAVCWG